MDLKPTERSILLGLLLVGDSLPVTIAEVTGRHARSVSRSVGDLKDLDFVVEKDRAVYALTPRGHAEARRILREASDAVERHRERNGSGAVAGSAGTAREDHSDSIPDLTASYDDLKPVERSILLGLLLVGDALPVTIAEATGRHARSVSRSVPRLKEYGLVIEKDRAVYALTPRGYSEARRVLREKASEVARERERDGSESSA